MKFQEGCTTPSGGLGAPRVKVWFPQLLFEGPSVPPENCQNIVTLSHVTTPHHWLIPHLSHLIRGTGARATLPNVMITDLINMK